MWWPKSSKQRIGSRAEGKKHPKRKSTQSKIKFLQRGREGQPGVPLYFVSQIHSSFHADKHSSIPEKIKKENSKKKKFNGIPETGSFTIFLNLAACSSGSSPSLPFFHFSLPQSQSQSQFICQCFPSHPPFSFFPRNRHRGFSLFYFTEKEENPLPRARFRARRCRQ